MIGSDIERPTKRAGLYDVKHGARSQETGVPKEIERLNSSQMVYTP